MRYWLSFVENFAPAFGATLGGFLGFTSAIGIVFAILRVTGLLTW